MSRTYWLAFCNDGVPLFDIERETRAEAINDLKEAYRFDYGEAGEGANYNDYYIEKYTETDDSVYVCDAQYFKMTMGKRGGVKAERIRNGV